MKILHAPVNIANQGWLLSRGQRLIGHDADVHAGPTGALQYAADRRVSFNEGPRSARVTAALRYMAEMVEADYDVFHFYYHASLLPKSYGIPPLVDVEILRGLSKKVFFHLVGCDFRLPSLSLQRNAHTMCVPCRACLDRDKIGILERIAGSASGLIAAGAHSQLFTGDFRFDTLPVAVDLGGLGEGGPQRDVPRVVHMPTNRAIKGTDAIIAAVEALQAEGVAFEFELIEGRPHDEATRVLREADVLIDQLGSDFHATAAIEAMGMGRVVVGHVLESAAAQYGERTPMVAADRHSLADVLRTLLPDVDERRRRAVDGRRFAIRHHDHVAVAERCIAIYQSPTAPVPSGRTAADIAAELRAASDAAMPAFLTTEAGGGAPPYAEITIETNVARGTPAPRSQPALAGAAASAGNRGGGSGGSPTTAGRDPRDAGDTPGDGLNDDAGASGTSDGAPAAPRFPFPIEPLDNPRLALPLHERFGQSLEDYVDDKFRLGRRFFRQRLEELGLRFDGPVLDMGCGPGQWALTIAEAHPNIPVVACDRNDFLYECLVEKKREFGLENLRTVQADIRELPFEDAYFHTTLCIGVLQLVKVSQAFAELVRVTRPGGTILINVPGAGFYARNSVGALRGGRRDILRQNVKFVRNTVKGQDVPFTFFTRRRLRSMARTHGLILDRVTPTGLYPPQRPRYAGLTVNMDVVFRRPAGTS